jgi:hypothetical protein
MLHANYKFRNWTCKHATEIQLFHFGESQKKVTLHKAIVHAYTSQNIWCFATISRSLRLNCGPSAASAVWASLKWTSLRDLRTVKADRDQDRPFVGWQPSTGKSMPIDLRLKYSPIIGLTCNIYIWVRQRDVKFLWGRPYMIKVVLWMPYISSALKSRTDSYIVALVTTYSKCDGG